MQDFKNWLSNHLLPGLWFVALMAILLLIVIVQITSTQEFFQSFFSNLLATTIGLIAGIPLALWISRTQDRAQERRENQAKQGERKARQQRILELLKVELEQNRLVLIDRQGHFKTGPIDYLNIPGVKNNLWNAFSAGGEFQYIDDVETLDVLSRAHYFNAWIVNLESLYSHPEFRYSVTIQRGSTSFDTISGFETIELMHKLVPQAIQATEAAIEHIDGKLKLLTA